MPIIHVVNCFRSFTYWPLSQLSFRLHLRRMGCELLSFFHLLTFVTVCGSYSDMRLVLWIAFVLSLIDLCHSFLHDTKKMHMVVNCFRSFTYWPLSQWYYHHKAIGVVVNCFRSFTYWPLSQSVVKVENPTAVVNCFRSFTYWPLSQ